MANGEDLGIPAIPFSELCKIVHSAVSSVKSADIVRSFEKTGLSLPVDGSQDHKMSRRMRELLTDVPAIESLPPKYQLMVPQPAATFFC